MLESDSICVHQTRRYSSFRNNCGEPPPSLRSKALSVLSARAGMEHRQDCSISSFRWTQAVLPRGSAALPPGWGCSRALLFPRGNTTSSHGKDQQGPSLPWYPCSQCPILARTHGCLALPNCTRLRSNWRGDLWSRHTNIKRREANHAKLGAAFLSDITRQRGYATAREGGEVFKSPV